MDQGLLTGAVFIDLQKAFDTVDHDLLLEKLTMGYGVTGKELGWFRDYLTNRRQVVTVQSTLSDPCDVAFGVPQGSILDHCCLCCSSMIYLLLSANVIYYYTLMILLFLQLDEANKWTISNFIFINKRKTEFVIFGTDARLSKATDTVVIKVDDNEIKRGYNFKY